MVEEDHGIWQFEYVVCENRMRDTVGQTMTYSLVNERLLIPSPGKNHTYSKEMGQLQRDKSYCTNFGINIENKTILA